MESAPIIIRCDASPSRGHGHLVRCLALADALIAAGAARPVFALLEDDQAAATVVARGFPVERPPLGAQANGSESLWLQELLVRTHARLLILDIRTDLGADVLLELRARGVIVVLIDDGSPRRLAADLVFLPPVPQVAELTWAGAVGKSYVGWDWIILRPEFAEPAPPRSPLGLARSVRVLVTMGGSDPAGLTLRALDELAHVTDSLVVDVVIGSGFRHERELRTVLEQSPLSYTLHRDVVNMVTLMRTADVAVASFGMTAYELASQAVPGVYFCLTPDHAVAASALCATGIATSLGVHDQVTPGALAAAVSKHIAQLRTSTFVAQRVIDGGGARRITHTLLSLLGAYPALD